MISIKFWPPPNSTQIKSITGRSQLQLLKVLLYKERGRLPKACWHFRSHEGVLTPQVSGAGSFFPLLSIETLKKYLLQVHFKCIYGIEGIDEVLQNTYSPQNLGGYWLNVLRCLFCHKWIMVALYGKSCLRTLSQAIVSFVGHLNKGLGACYDFTVGLPEKHRNLVSLLRGLISIELPEMTNSLYPTADPGVQ